MTKTMHEGDLVKYDGCDRVYSFHSADFASKQRENVIDSFVAIYIDDLGNTESCRGFLFLLEPSLNIILDGGRELEVKYTSVESLNILQQREITALRVFLVGPMWAAWLKKETKTLAIGLEMS